MDYVFFSMYKNERCVNNITGVYEFVLGNPSLVYGCQVSLLFYTWNAVAMFVWSDHVSF